MTCQMAGQGNLFDLDTWCGRMYREPCQVTKEKTSKPSSQRSLRSSTRMRPMCLCLMGSGQSKDVSTMRWEDGALLGEYTMHSFGEQPSTLMRECSLGVHHNGVSESHLSQILEEEAHPKYFLSEKACRGIIRRAKEKNKPLPEELEQALNEQLQSKGTEADSLTTETATK